HVLLLGTWLARPFRALLLLLFVGGAFAITPLPVLPIPGTSWGCSNLTLMSNPFSFLSVHVAKLFLIAGTVFCSWGEKTGSYYLSGAHNLQRPSGATSGFNSFRDCP